MQAKYVSLLFISVLLSVSQVWAQKTDKAKEEKKDTYSLTSSSVSTLKFRSLGPALMSGRIVDFAVNPNNSSEYYVAVGCGHVWKTTNAGINYFPVFDGQKSYSIGCVCIDPSNTNVVWVGSGENNSQRSVAYGDGIYKSLDGGASWTNMGLKKSEHIGKILVHPSNSNIVYVAAQGPLWAAGGDRGLYKTTDGGKTWNKVLNISENTGVSDIAFDPRNPDVIYASAYQRRRHVWTLVDGGPESAIYKSEDGGASWRKLTSGLPSGDLGRIGIAVSPKNPDYVFAIIELPGSTGAIYRSTNRGESWEKRTDFKSASPQYYHELFCDPNNENSIYIPDTYSKYSDDGGKTLNAFSTQSRHVDDHAFWVDSKNTNHLLIGGDGGLYESFDRGRNWDFKENLPITQFYRVAVDNALPFYNIYGGTQDNNSLGGPSQTRNRQGISNADWFITTGGDGFWQQVDPTDPNIVYSESQYGGLVRYDKITGVDLDIRPMEPDNGEVYRWNWDAPLKISSHDHNTLYFAANKLFKSTDKGNTWKVISPDLTRQLDRNLLPVMGKIQSPEAVAKNGSTSLYGNLVSLSESPVKKALVYTGSDDGLISVTEDDGNSWNKISTFAGVPETTYVSCIFASQHDENVVYASFDNHKNADFKPYILKSTDKGKTWKSIAGNLPTDEVVYSINEDPVNKNLIFAGTEYGIYFRIDEGAHWIKLSNGIPSIAVRDIAIQKRENALVVATFGRGFYVIDDYSILRSIKDVQDKNENYIFPVKTALMFNYSSPIGYAKKGYLGDNYWAAENPTYGVNFTFYSKEEFQSLKSIRLKKEAELTKAGKPIDYPSYEQLRKENEEVAPNLLIHISDLNGNLIKVIRKSISKGLQNVVWDMNVPNVYPKSGDSKDDNGGIPVAPGKYKVTLAIEKDGKTTNIGNEQIFEIKSLYESKNADLAENLKFRKEVEGVCKDYYALQHQFTSFNQKAKAINNTLELSYVASPEMKSKSKELMQKLDSLSILWYGDDFLEGQNAAFPPSLASRAGNIQWGLNGTSEVPTQTMKDNLVIVKNRTIEWEKYIQKLDIEYVKVLEAELNRINATYTPGREIK